jgi:predicted metal-dependent hydrolase
MKPSTPPRKVRRLLPKVPLPPYSYVYGKFPHPERDPAGHSYQTPPRPVPLCQPQRWSKCSSYLRGIDLFNFGYYWEAHEEWELLWNGAGRHGALANFVKGLIILACAGVKAREGRPQGVEKHARRAAQLFQRTATTRLAAQGVAMGLCLDELIAAATALEERPVDVINTSDRPVEIVMPFALIPRDE